LFGWTKVLLTIAACSAALPAGAQVAAPTTAFDGKYAGVSREFSKSPGAPRAKCTPNSTPAALTIKNGVVEMPGGQGWQGTVNPQGTLAMHNRGELRFDGQIDNQGTIRGQAANTGCIYTFVWRKQSG